MKTSGRETLAQLVKRLRKEKDFSLGQVESNSGGRITNGHVNRIENAYTENLTSDKLQALADGLQVSPMLLCEALFGYESPVDPQEEEVLIQFRSMSVVARSYLLLIARAFRGHRAEMLPLETVPGNVEKKKARSSR